MRVVLCNGCFDPLHGGHVFHLMAAKDMGDKLVVAITDDRNVRLEKGEGRPVMGAWQRWAAVKELRCVDAAFITSGALAAIKYWTPNVFVKGIDYKGRIGADVDQYCRQHGIEIRITNTPKLSSTELLNELKRG